MDKVKLPKVVAEAIENQRNKECLSNYGMIQLWDRMKNPEHLNEHMKIMKNYFKDKCADLYVEVVVNGYEVEMTPEEKVKMVFDGYACMDKNIGLFSGPDVACVIARVCETFGKEIEGVNKI